ncbi:hypothetical protein [Zhouia spongiae]|nr:hypothetical protein [Zhouia spongiae]
MDEAYQSHTKAIPKARVMHETVIVTLVSIRPDMTDNTQKGI